MIIQYGEQHRTITEAHPYHGRQEHLAGFQVAVKLDRDAPANEIVFEQFDPACPLCRREREERNGRV
jgi:hypothetical protein